MRSRSPSEDEETLEFKRRESASGVIFEQMVRQLAAPLTRTSRHPNPAALILRMPPNVFETPSAAGDPPPPWAPTKMLTIAKGAPAAAPQCADTEVETHALNRPTPRARAKRSFKVPSLLFIMSLGIGYGLGQDPAARAPIVTKVKAAAHATIAFVDR